MKTKAELLFLGTGGSMGIPVIGCDCEVCLSSDPKNGRMRPSALLKIEKKHFLIDCTPEYRIQALRAGIQHLDGVLMTHAHYDHSGGIDDLRMHCRKGGGAIPCLMSKATEREIRIRYPYLFPEEKKEGPLVAKLALETVPEESTPFIFQGIELRAVSYEQIGMPVNGFIFGNLAYISDIRIFSESIYKELQGIETLVISALRFAPSKIHFTVDEALSFARRIEAKRVFLTHISHELDHEKTNAYLPENTELAYDGLTIDLELTYDRPL